MFRFLCRLFLLVCICSLIAACTQRVELIPYPQKHTLLVDRSNEFFKNLIQKKYERMFDMLSETTRAETDKDAYLESFKDFFQHFQVHATPSEVKHRDEKSGVTKTTLLLEFESKKFNICLQLEWIWEKNNWYVNDESEVCLSASGEFKQ